MHSSRMRTAHSSSHHGGRLHTPWNRHPPWSRHPPGQIPPTSSLGVGLDQIPSTSPLAVGLDQIPLNFPLGCRPGDPPWPDPPKLLPWVWAWKPARHAGKPPPLSRPAARHAGIPPAMHAGIAPPPLLWTEYLTHASFADGNKR